MAQGREEARTAPPRDPDAPLVERCQHGDEAAFHELYLRYFSKIHGHVRAITANPSDVDDVVQKTFVQAYKNIRKFEGRGRFSSWIHGIAVRVVLNWRRSDRRRQAAIMALAREPETAVPADEQMLRRVDERQMVRRLEELVRQLPPKKRIPFVLYYVERLEVTEIAALSGMSVDATWRRIQRARDALTAAVQKAERARGREASRRFR